MSELFCAARYRKACEVAAKEGCKFLPMATRQKPAAVATNYGIVPFLVAMDMYHALASTDDPAPKWLAEQLADLNYPAWNGEDMHSITKNNPVYFLTWGRVVFADITAANVGARVERLTFAEFCAAVQTCGFTACDEDEALGLPFGRWTCENGDGATWCWGTSWDAVTEEEDDHDDHEWEWETEPEPEPEQVTLAFH